MSTNSASNQFFKSFHIPDKVQEQKTKMEEVVKKFDEEIRSKPTTLKIEAKRLGESISQSEQKIKDALSEQYTPTQKSIKENYIKLQKEFKSELEDIKIERKQFKHDVKEFSTILSEKSEKIEKMQKEIENVNRKNNPIVRFFKNPLGNHAKDKEIQFKHEMKIFKNTVRPSEKIVLNAEKDLEFHSDSAQSIAGKINTLFETQDTLNQAVKARMKLAGDLHQSINDIDDSVKVNSFAIKHSSPDLAEKLTKINEELLEKRNRISDLEKDLAVTPFDLEGKRESSLMTSLTEGYYGVDDIGLQNEISNLADKASHMRSLRPEISSLSHSKGVISSVRKSISLAFEKTPSEEKIKEINTNLEEKINHLNDLLGKFADGIVSKSSPGEIYGELEKQHDNFKNSRNLEYANEKNKALINKFETNFSVLSTFENTERVAEEFLQNLNLNLVVGNEIKGFNNQLMEFADKVLSSKKEKPKVNNKELENQYQNFNDDWRLKHANPDTLALLDTSKKNFEALSITENPKLAAAKFRYINILEKSIGEFTSKLSKIPSDNLVQNREGRKTPLQTLDESGQFIQAQLDDLESKLKKLPEDFSKTVAEFKAMSSGDDNLEARKILANQFLENRMTSEKIGTSISDAYIFSVEAEDKTTREQSDYFDRGVGKRIPQINLEVSDLNLMYNSMKKLDKSNENNYQGIQDNLKSLSQELLALRATIDQGTAKEAGEKLESLTRMIETQREEIQSMQFGLNEGNKFILNGNVTSFGDRNQEFLLDSLNNINTNLHYIKEYVNELPQESPIPIKDEKKLADQPTEPQVKSYQDKFDAHMRRVGEKQDKIFETIEEKVQELKGNEKPKQESILRDYKPSKSVIDEKKFVEDLFASLDSLTSSVDVPKPIEKTQLKLVPQSKELQIDGRNLGTVHILSNNTFTAVYGPDIRNMEDRFNFIKEGLTFYKDNGIQDPFMQLPNGRYMILDEKGNLKKISPDPITDDDKQALEQLLEKAKDKNATKVTFAVSLTPMSPTIEKKVNVSLNYSPYGSISIDPKGELKASYNTQYMRTNSISEFMKNSLTFFQENGYEFESPYIQLKNGSIFYLDENGEMKKIHPDTADENTKEIIDKLLTKGKKVTFLNEVGESI